MLFRRNVGFFVVQTQCWIFFRPDGSLDSHRPDGMLDSRRLDRNVGFSSSRRQSGRRELPDSLSDFGLAHQIYVLIHKGSLFRDRSEGGNMCFLLCDFRSTFEK